MSVASAAEILKAELSKSVMEPSKPTGKPSDCSGRVGGGYEIESTPPALCIHNASREVAPPGRAELTPRTPATVEDRGLETLDGAMMGSAWVCCGTRYSNSVRTVG